MAWVIALVALGIALAAGFVVLSRSVEGGGQTVARHVAGLFVPPMAAILAFQLGAGDMITHVFKSASALNVVLAGGLLGLLNYAPVRLRHEPGVSALVPLLASTLIAVAVVAGVASGPEAALQIASGAVLMLLLCILMFGLGGKRVGDG